MNYPSCEQVNASYFISEYTNPLDYIKLPQSLIPWNQDFSLIEFIIRQAIKVIQDESGKNPVRIYFANLMSNNYYNNEQFFELVSVINDLIQVDYPHQQELDPRIISARVNECCSIFCAHHFSAFPAKERYCSPQLLNSVIDGSREVIPLLNKIKGKQMQPRLYGQPPGQYHQPQPQQNYYQHPQQLPGYQQPPAGYPPYPPMQSNQPAYPNQMIHPNQMPPPNQMMHSGHMQGVQQAFSNGPASPVSKSSDSFVFGTPEPAKQPTQQPAQRIEDVVIEECNIDFDEVDNTPPTQEKLKEIWKASRKFTDEPPVYYNTLEQHKYYEMDENGDVHEVIKEIDGMNYNKHEIVKTMSSYEKLHEGKIVPLEDLCSSKFIPITDQITSMDAEERQKFFDKNNIFIDKDVIIASNLNQGLCTHKLTKLNIPSIKNRTSLFSYKEAIVFVDELIETSRGEERVSELVKRLIDSKDITGYIERFNGLMRLDDFPRDILSMLNKASTEATNIGLNIGVNITWTIDNFIKDWRDLQGEFLDTFSREQGEAYYAELIKYVEKDIIGGGWLLLDPVESAKAFSKGGPLSQFEEHKSNLFVLVKPVVLVDLPYSSQRLAIDFNAGKHLTIKPSVSQNLYNFVEEVFEQVEKYFYKTSKVLLRTSDGEMMEINTGAFSKKHYVIRQL